MGIIPLVRLKRQAGQIQQVQHIAKVQLVQQTETDDIKLGHYNDENEKWEQLDTTFIGLNSDGINYDFKAIAPTLSVFAVIGIEEGGVPPPQPLTVDKVIIASIIAAIIVITIIVVLFRSGYIYVEKEQYKEYKKKPPRNIK